MVEAALAAGALVALAVIAAADAGPGPRVAVPRRVRTFVAAALASELGMARRAGLEPSLVATAQLAAGVAAGLVVGLVAGMPVLSVAAAVASAAGVRLAIRVRANAGVRKRQDEVLEAVRMLRSILESGGAGAQEAVAALARKGPASLREEFSAVAAAARTGDLPRAWSESRARVADPLFDLLAAALIVQRPSGGSLAPLFADLEESVAAIHEVAREAEALQVQARSAAGLVVLLPVAFLLVLSAFHSPYLDAYRAPAGAAFLAAMLAVIGLSYLWILRWLRLPGEPRLELA